MLSPLGVKGQDILNYLSKVEGDALIYRGEIEQPYNFRYSGTYFAYAESYSEGFIYFNDKLYEGVLINLNAHTGQVSVKQTKDHLAVHLKKELVKWFVMGDHFFINLTDMERVGMASDYYEVLEDGEIRLLKRVTKECREDLTSNGQNSSITRVFESRCEYYIEKGGQYTKVKGKRTFIKLFGDKKREINQTFRDAPKVVRHDKDEMYKRVIREIR